MNLVIKGHQKKGKKIIEIFEMLGGINELDLKGTEAYSYYYIDDSSNIIYCVLSVSPNDYNVYSLEKFLEKFPYKVGDKVKNVRIEDFIGRITNAQWDNNENQIIYTVEWNDATQSKLTYFARGLQPYKEEIIEEINIDRIGFNGNKAKLVLPDGYEFKTEGKDAYIIKKKPQYPKTYEECCEAIGINRYDIEIDLPQTYQQKMFNLFKLLICRDAYWKIAGEQMGLDGSWEPDYITEDNQLVYIITTQRGYLSKNTSRHWNYILAFPTEEMRDKFYENFKELIEQCKELL